MLQCPRCGYHPISEIDLCWACADGVADEQRAARLIAAAGGSRDAARILRQVRDRRAVPVLLNALADGSAGSAREAVLLAVAAAAPDSVDVVSVLLHELEHQEAEVAEAAIEALADTTAQSLLVDEALAGVMATRPELKGKAARALAWRHDPRAVPVLKREIVERGVSVEGGQAATFMLGRCGPEGRAVLGERLAAILSQHPDSPEHRFQEPDSSVFWLLHGLLGRSGAPIDPEGAEVARAVTADHPWARERLDELIAERQGDPPPGRPRPQPIDAAMRVVPRWGMKLRRVSTPRPGLTTRFGGQPFFPGDPAWPLHPTLSIPLTFLGQIVIPPTVLGDGTWLAHVFVDVSPDDFVNDPEYPYPVPATAVVVHPGAKWWGPTAALRVGPTYAYERPDYDVLDARRFVPGPQFGFVTTEVDLLPGADPIAWPRDVEFEYSNDDWMKVGGTPLTLQGGEDQWIAKGWKFLASFGAGRVGHEMGDVAECYVWLHPDGRGLLDVHSH